MKIVALTGAGISQESGIKTFRDEDGLWENYNVDEVSSIKAWENDPEKVLQFYNHIRGLMCNKKPNDAHKVLKELETENDVCIITQNIDDLHEKAGSSNVIHLHGELNKKSSNDKKHISTWDNGYEMMLGDLDINGEQIRPHVVWFGELPHNVEEAYSEILGADLLLIIGTSLKITYIMDMLSQIDEDKTTVMYIDPNPSDFMDGITHVEYIKEKASIGLKKLWGI